MSGSGEEVANPHQPTEDELIAERDELVAELTRLQGLVGKPYMQQVITASITELEADIAALNALIDGGGPAVAAKVPKRPRDWV